MKTSLSQTKNNEFYYRIVEEDCECGAGKEVLYRYNDYQHNGKREAIGWFCGACGNKKKPPKIELPKIEKKIIICRVCKKQVETGIFNPPMCWKHYIENKRALAVPRQ